MMAYSKTTRRYVQLTPKDKRTAVESISDVWDQAVGYVNKLKLTQCRKILLTQGARVYLYQKEGDRWSDEPTGYVNAERIRTNHLAPANTNAVETLIALTPAGI